MYSLAIVCSECLYSASKDGSSSVPKVLGLTMLVMQPANKAYIIIIITAIIVIAITTTIVTVTITITITSTITYFYYHYVFGCKLSAQVLAKLATASREQGIGGGFWFSFESWQKVVSGVLE